MESYQMLSIAGGTIGVMISFGVFAAGTLDIITEKNDNINDDTTKGTTITAITSNLQESSIAAAAAILLYLVTIISPMFIANTKIIGAMLLGIAFATVFILYIFAAIQLMLLVPAGIIALRFKSTHRLL